MTPASAEDAANPGRPRRLVSEAYIRDQIKDRTNDAVVRQDALDEIRAELNEHFNLLLEETISAWWDEVEVREIQGTRYRRPRLRQDHVPRSLMIAQKVLEASAASKDREVSSSAREVSKESGDPGAV